VSVWDGLIIAFFDSWIDHDAWPVQHEIYGYLPRCRLSPPLVRYQIILLSEHWTEARVWTTCTWQCHGPESNL